MAADRHARAGSGKSLTYIVPIVDRVLREGSGRGVRAIVVYPMNALANSQLEELSKFLKYGYGEVPPVTFDRYTGQEGHDERQRILAQVLLQTTTRTGEQATWPPR